MKLRGWPRCAAGVALAITAGGSPGWAQVTTTYSYDVHGQVTAVARPANTVTYGYDAAGNRVQLGVVTPPVASDGSLSVGYNSSANLIPPVSGSVTGLVIDSNPAKGTVSASGTVLTYTATWPNYGADSFTYHAVGPAGTSATRTINVTIGNGAAPTASNGSSTTAYNTPVTFLYPVAGDYAGPTLDSSPAHGSLSTLTYVVNVGWQQTYTPTAGYVGADSWVFHATSPFGSSPTRTYTVTTNAAPVNHAPVAVNDTLTLQMGDNVDIRVTANDTDADGDVLTVTGVSPASSNRASYAFYDGYISVFAKNRIGVDTVTYTISDGRGGTASATLQIVVTQIQ